MPGFLEAGDLADVEAALAPRPLLLEDIVDAKNRIIPEKDLRGELQPIYDGYRQAPENLSVRSGEHASHVAEWLRAHLQLQ